MATLPGFQEYLGDWNFVDSREPNPDVCVLDTSPNLLSVGTQKQVNILFKLIVASKQSVKRMKADTVPLRPVVMCVGAGSSLLHFYYSH